jgi:hypothetical protein
MKTIDAAEALVNLERVVGAVKGRELQESKFARVLATLKTLSRQEDIPLAIVGGLAAIHHGYECFTKDIDVVVRSGNLDILTRVAPHYGIKVIWNDPEGWHKLQCEGVPIDVVPEGRKPTRFIFSDLTSCSRLLRKKRNRSVNGAEASRAAAFRERVGLRSNSENEGVCAGYFMKRRGRGIPRKWITVPMPGGSRKDGREPRCLSATQSGFV